MLNTGEPEQSVDDGVLPEAKPACVALVPVTSSVQWSQAPGRLPRPNPVFVTHLIATAAQGPANTALVPGNGRRRAECLPCAPTPDPGCRHPHAANHLTTTVVICAYQD